MSSAEEFENYYKDAYKIIDEGITLVTEGENDKASSIFDQGISLIDQALSIKVETLDVSAQQIQIYTEMQNKMRITRKEVMLHFSNSHGQANSRSSQRSDDDPPSYEEYLSSIQSEEAGSSKPISYPSLDPKSLQLQNMETNLNAGASPLVTPVMSPQNGERIFHIEDGVQIFFIYSNGRVTSPSYPSFLSVFTFHEPICSNDQSGYPGARGFLQVGEWNYPLIPSLSPVLHSFYGAYMFPDVSNPVPGTSVGILIPDYVVKDDREVFEQILSQLTSFQEQIVPQGVDAETERVKIADKTSGERIAEGAEAVSKGVIWGADKLTEWISYGSDKLKESLTPEAQQRMVDPKWQKTAKVARNVSGKAVKISGFLLSQIGKATLALGKWAAPTIQRHGTKAIGRITGHSEKDVDSQVGTVMEVAAGAVKGASTVYMSLENAAATLAVSLSENTVKVVTHKYGDEYGKLTDNTLFAVGQTAMAGHNISSLGVKGIAKKTAKDTGKAVVGQYGRKWSDGQLSVEKHDIMEGVEEGSEATETLAKGNGASFKEKK